jgi:hypothetical protein
LNNIIACTKTSATYFKPQGLSLGRKLSLPIFWQGQAPHGFLIYPTLGPKKLPHSVPKGPLGLVQGKVFFREIKKNMQEGHFLTANIFTANIFPLDKSQRALWHRVRYPQKF